MGIDKANNILGMSNKLGPEVEEKLLSNAIAVDDTCTHNSDNVFHLKEEHNKTKDYQSLLSLNP